MSGHSQESEQRTVVVGPGVRAPYPNPTSSAASKIALGNRRRDTKPEIALRSALHRLGLRFRKDHTVVAGKIRVRPDVVFTKAKVAVFVDGCFWHSCPLHGSVPASNRAYWSPKLQSNRTRDERVNDALRASGWTVVRLWEHDEVAMSARFVEATVIAARSGRAANPL